MAWKKSLFFFVWQSLRYARDRAHFQQMWSYRRHWFASFQPGRGSVADEQAWITFPALDVLEQNLRPGFRVFEFGGGGSTLFFLKNGAQVVTVEDHAEWFKTLTETVRTRQYRDWEGHFVAPEPAAGGRERSHKNPADFASGARGLEKLDFERYARAIDPFPENYFDLVLVDGRARPSCIQQALPHLKSGGLLVVDNTERAYYTAPFRDVFARDFEVVLDRRAPTPYSPDFTCTTILRKK